MKKLLTTLSDKWAEYILEILVITIGILGAFALNNWNEDRKENAKREDLLLSLQSDLNSDIHSIKLQNKRVIERADFADYLLQLLDDLPATIDTPKVTMSLERVGFIHSFNPTLATYNQMLGSGMLDILDNDELAKGLSEYASLVNSAIRIESKNADYTKYIDFVILKYISEGFAGGTFETPPDSYKKIAMDLKSMSRDVELVAYLRLIHNKSYSEVKYRNNFIQTKALSLLGEIEKQLAN